MEGFIYLIISPTGHKYVGQTADISDRMYRYKTLRCKSQKRLYRSIKFHGFDNHRIIILERVPISQLLEVERFWVEELKTNCSRYPKNKGLNLTDGGIGVRGRKTSNAQKAMISKVHKGKIMSEELRIKIALAGIGRKHSEESKLKMSEKQKGGIRSQEQRIKISNSLKGRNAHRKLNPIFKIDRNTGFILKRYNWMSEAAIELGNINKIANICAVCKGKLKTAYNFKWEYDKGQYKSAAL